MHSPKPSPRAAALGRWLFAPLLALLAVIPASAQYSQSIELDTVSINVESHWPPGIFRGWVPMAVEMRSLDSGSQTVNMKLSARFGWNTAGFRMDRSVELEPFETKTVDLLVPCDRVGGGTNYDITFSDGKKGTGVGLPFGSGGVHYSGRVICLLAPSQIDPVSLASIQAALPRTANDGVSGVMLSDQIPPWFSDSSRRFGRGSTPEQIATVFAPPMWRLPKDLAAWTSVDTIVVDARQPVSAEPEWEPILSWVRLGGQIVFLGDNAEANASAIPGLGEHLADRFEIATGESDRRMFRAARGLVAFYDWAPGVDPAGRPGVPLGQAGDALRILGGLDDVAGDPNRVKPAHRSQSRTIAWQSASSLGAGYRRRSPWPEPFELPELPMRVVLALLIGFGVVIGPLNMRFLKKRNRPGLLFVTVPVLSILTTVGILAFGLLQQGLSTRGHEHSITVLDQTQAHATMSSRREMFVGSGGSSLRPKPSTVVMAPDRERESDVRVMKDDGRSTVLAGAFLPVRTKTEHFIHRDAASRARLEVAAKGTGLEITNGLGDGVQVRDIEVIGPDGTLFGFEEGDQGLPPGSSATLVRLEASRWEEWPLAASEPLFHGFDVPLGGYIARVSKSPAADDCGVTMDAEYEEHLLLGILDADAKEWGL